MGPPCQLGVSTSKIGSSSESSPALPPPKQVKMRHQIARKTQHILPHSFGPTKACPNKVWESMNQGLPMRLAKDTYKAIQLARSIRWGMGFNEAGGMCHGDPSITRTV
eukprot:6471231-Amphidinium_carterae.2